MSCFDGVHEENPSVSGLSEPTASTFKHTPLQDPQQSLCLSTFERLAPDGSLGFHLNTFPFISSLIYNAVSYECGSPDDKLTIFVNGMPFLIYRNLHIFLSQLQAHGFDDTPIFADAISIDQTDIPERNAQVQMMGRIYKQAQTVMIWLGPAADGSDLVFNSLNSEGHALEELTGDDESPEKYAGDGSEYPALNSQSAAKSMVAVFKRTYWYRLWVIQELFLARRPQFCCGTRVTTFMKLYSLFRALETIVRNTGVVGAINEERWKHIWLLFIVLRERLRPHVKRLWQLFLWFGCSHCLETRDRVYGFLGMAEGNSPHGMVVDYGVPLEVLLLRLLKAKDLVYTFEEACFGLTTLQLDADVSKLSLDNKLISPYVEEFRDVKLQVWHMYAGTLTQKRALNDVHGNRVEGADALLNGSFDIHVLRSIFAVYGQVDEAAY